MTKKSEFMPVVSRIKLNPEQAVLQCSCYSFEWRWTSYTAQKTDLPAVPLTCLNITPKNGIVSGNACINDTGSKWAGMISEQEVSSS